MEVNNMLYGLLTVSVFYCADAMVLDSAVNNTKPIDCLKEDGVMGKCVHFIRCNDTVDYSDRPWRPQEEVCDAAGEICCLDDIKPSTFQLREGCGWANPKGFPANQVIRGDHNYARFAEYPWMCAVLNKSSSNLDEKPEYLGGGSLIHPSVVLTAAHLVTKQPVATNLIIRVGEYDTQTDQELYPHQDRNVAAVEVHEDFNRRLLNYNIALLFLEKPVDLAPNVGVACLPPPPSHSTQVGANSNCVATGWGKHVFGKEGRYTAKLKKVKVPLVDHAKCQGELQKTRLGAKFELHSTFLCAGGEGVDTCLGDGGSPLACPLEEPDRYVQAGIVAWGIGCSGPAPAVYVDVAKQRDWIDDKILGRGYDTKVYSA